MDNRPIGVFDSGLGGLTAVREIINRLPSENIVYFGDTGRVPYGVRSRETILKYARQDIRFLQTFDLKAIVIACGTVSTIALDTVVNEYSIPIYGVVGPTAERAARITSNNKIGLIGTRASIQSGAYEALIKAQNPRAQVFGIPCPLFVPMVENGRYQRGDIVIETIAAEYLRPLKEQGVDTLVLGCTHYPLLSEVISDYMGDAVSLINSGVEVVSNVAVQMKALGLLADPSRRGSCAYYVSDSVDGFSQLASVFLDRDIEGAVEKIDVENYQAFDCK